MDNPNDNDRELLENVTISDVSGSQYMIQRMSVDNTQLLNTDLLTHHTGLVVDLGGTDFIPVNYTSEELQQLTEEDRNLAAALVAVQLSQQQKQQQIQQDTANVLNTAIPGLVTNTALDNSKVSLNDQQLLLTEKSVLNNGYLQIVGANNLYENFNPNQHIKSEEDLNLKDSDGENKSDVKTSRKSLPHKKRISRKLKKPLPTSRKLNKCTLCEQTFSNNDEYLQHQQLCRTTITPITPATLFNCQICQAAFQDQLTFFEHLKTHYEPSVQVHLQDNDSTELIRHDELKENIKIESETPKDSLLSSLLNLHCIHCNKSFRRQKAYEAHIRDAHNKEELNEFSEPEDLMAGIDVVVDPNEANSEDDVKNWTEYRDDELYATEEDLKELEAQDHVCHLCKQPFPMRAILLQHLITCRESNNQIGNSVDVPKKKVKKKVGELSCTECDRVFTHRNSLVYHMRSHTGDRPHQCEQCGKSFFAASALKVHKRLHSGDKPYKCEECGRNFRQWGDLKYHTISLHSNQKQYQCEYCGKDFARKYSLIVHRRIHTGEKNYKCEFCGKTFRASSYLQNHRRIHTGEKPHNCDVCGKPFRVRSDMKRHMKTHVRRKLSRPANTSPNSCNVMITKLEETENVDSILQDSEDTNELITDKQENSIEIQYEQDPLVAERDGNTLYTNGHQVFVFYSSDLPVRTGDASNPSWIQTN